MPYMIVKIVLPSALSCSGVCTSSCLCQPVYGDVLKCYIVEIELYIVFGELQLTLRHRCVCGCQFRASHLPHPNSPWNKALKDEERLELLFQCGSRRHFHSIMPFTLRACLTKSRSNSIQARYAHSNKGRLPNNSPYAAMTCRLPLSPVAELAPGGRMLPR